MSIEKYICPKCKNEVNFGDKFCGKCGFQFGDWGQTNAEQALPEQNSHALQDTEIENSGKSGIIGKILKIVLGAIILLLAIFAGVSFWGSNSPKDLVADAIKNKSEAEIVKVYNKQKDTKEKSEFIKQVCLAYKEQVEKDFAGEKTKSFYEDPNTESIGRLLKQISPEQEPKLLPLADLHRNLARLGRIDKELSASRNIQKIGDMDITDITGKIQERNFYISHKLPFQEKRHLSIAVRTQYIGDPFNPFSGGVNMPTADYEAVIETPREDNLRDGSGMYELTVAQAGTYTLKDIGGFTRTLPLFKCVSREDLNSITAYKNLKNQRNDLAEHRIPAKLNNFITWIDSINSKNSEVSTTTSVNKSKKASDNSVPSISSGKITNTTQSSADNENGYVHSAALTVDGDIKTCWTEGEKGLGIGEYIQIYFNGTYKVSGLNIWAGHQKSQDLFYKNARPAAIRVIGSDGSNAVYPLEDKMGMQRVNFTSPINVSDIKIVVEKAMRGNKYEDTCIGEVSFF